MADNSQSATLHFPDEFWAVFNLHANLAGVRAMKITEQRFGSVKDEKTAKMLADLRRDFDDKTIMAIFEKKANRVTQFFADTVFILANGLEAKEREARGPQDDGIVYADGKLPDLPRRRQQSLSERESRRERFSAGPNPHGLRHQLDLIRRNGRDRGRADDRHRRCIRRSQH